MKPGGGGYRGFASESGLRSRRLVAVVLGEQSRATRRVRATDLAPR